MRNFQVPSHIAEKGGMGYINLLVSRQEKSMNAFDCSVQGVPGRLTARVRISPNCIVDQGSPFDRSEFSFLTSPNVKFLTLVTVLPTH
jgi:hypothetical protein